VPNLKQEEKLSPNLRVTHYSVAEHEGFISVWTGGGDPRSSPPHQETGIEQPDCEAYGSGVTALGMDHYRAILFDAPQILFDIPGIRMTDFYLGGLNYDKGCLVIDREAEWGDASKPANIKAVDRNLVLRTEHAVGINKVSFKLIDESETVLATLSLAYCESRRGTTRYCWRFYRHRKFARLQPVRCRLRTLKRVPVMVNKALDGHAVASTLVGPSEDVAVFLAQKISSLEEGPAL
jgi:hypothetical protein